jgi:hypothetical protein
MEQQQHQSSNVALHAIPTNPNSSNPSVRSTVLMLHWEHCPVFESTTGSLGATTSINHQLDSASQSSKYCEGRCCTHSMC